MDAQRLKVMLTHRRKGDRAIWQYGDLRAVGGMYRKTGDVIDDDRLYVCEILHTEECELSGGHMPDACDIVHFNSLPGRAVRADPIYER